MSKKPKIKKVDGASKDVWAEHVKRLKQEFPEVVSESQVDCEQLKRLVGEENVAQGERYSFTWAGKSQAFQEIKERTTATLKPTREESVGFDDTENIFIEGENLEALRILQKAYYGKVKMIYIDPPYNTGKDFIYKDNFRRTQQEEEEAAGNVDEGGNLKSGLVRNTKTGRYHSNWLNMMYPRLFLARNLLRDDGVIFISIDDNEVHNLRHIMDEIFGEENFYGNITWQNRSKPKNMGDAKYSLQQNTEYVLVYGKVSSDKFNFELPTTLEKQYPKEDKSGKYREEEIQQRKNLGSMRRESMVYELLGISPRQDYRWQLSPQKRDILLKEKKLIKKGQKVYKKVYESEEEGFSYEPFWSHRLDVDTAETAKEELENLMGTDEIFDTVKPTNLVTQLLNFIPKNCLVLDFFAGSGTTAHAVMAQNAEDGGNRKYIMVQLDEEVDEDSEAGKAGYENIAQIARERIRRAGSAIVEEFSEQKTQYLARSDYGEDEKDLSEIHGDSDRFNWNEDVGFKAFKVAESSFMPWRRERVESEEELQQKLEDAVENLKDGANKESVLFELMLKLGISPNAEVEEKEGYYLLDGEHAICLEDKITEKLVERVVAEEPHVFVCLDSAFAGNDELKTNTALQFQSKNIEFKVV